MNEYKILFLYHDPCTDGFLCRIIAECYYANSKNLDYKREVTYVGVNPSTLTADLERISQQNQQFNIALMFDVSTAPQNYQQLTKLAERVVVFDHHEATLKNFGLVVPPWLVFDDKKCGSRLAFEYFYGTGVTVPKIVQYVEARDLWLFGKPNDPPNSKEITTFLYNEPFKLPFQPAENYFHLLFHTNDQYWDEAVVKGQNMLAEIDKKVADIVGRMRRGSVQLTKNGLKNFLVVETADYVSEAGSKAVGENADVDFILMWCTDDQNRIRLSLRSDAKRCNVNDVAKEMWSGGGHPPAAGALLTNEVDKQKFFDFIKTSTVDDF